MSDYNPNPAARYGTTAARDRVAVDEGLRAYMIGVYNYMTIGLAITAAVALGAFMLAVTTDPATGARSLTEIGQLLYASPLKWVVIFAPLALVFFLSFRIESLSVGAAQSLFWGYAALVGLSLSVIFLVFTGQSIARVLFITAASFGALSLYGYTTKRDISGWGAFLIMGLIGLIVAMIINIFVASAAMQFAISVIGLLIFAGLTAYDTQRLKNEYLVMRGTEGEAYLGKAAILGALSLYLNFINMFMFLLQFLGQRE